eukprot:321512-Hanusia_phi.AAC.3
MNCSPLQAVAMLELVLPALAPQAHVILTMKKFSETGKCTQTSFEQDKQQAMSRLQVSDGGEEEGKDEGGGREVRGRRMGQGESG